MTQGEVQGLFELSKLPCLEAVVWVSAQDDQSVEGLLATCERPDWRGFVARFSRSAAILERMAQDENWWVRRGVARNPSTPVVILEKLIGDEDWWVRVGLARNPSTPVVILEGLAKDESGLVREQLASNPQYVSFIASTGAARHRRTE